MDQTKTADLNRCWLQAKKLHLVIQTCRVFYRFIEWWGGLNNWRVWNAFYWIFIPKLHRKSQPSTSLCIWLLCDQYSASQCMSIPASYKRTLTSSSSISTCGFSSASIITLSSWAECEWHYTIHGSFMVLVIVDAQYKQYRQPCNWHTVKLALWNVGVSGGGPLTC